MAYTLQDCTVCSESPPAGWQHSQQPSRLLGLPPAEQTCPGQCTTASKQVSALTNSRQTLLSVVHVLTVLTAVFMPCTAFCCMCCCTSLLMGPCTLTVLELGLHINMDLQLSKSSCYRSCPACITSCLMHQCDSPGPLALQRLCCRAVGV